MAPPPILLTNMTLNNPALPANASITFVPPHTRPIPVAETTCWTYTPTTLQSCCVGNGTSWTSESASAFNKTHTHAGWINGNITGAHGDTIYACTIAPGRDFTLLDAVGKCLLDSLGGVHWPPVGGFVQFPEQADQWKCEHRMPSAASASAGQARKAGAMALLVVLASAALAL